MRAEIWKEILRQNGCLNNGRVQCTDAFRIRISTNSNNHQTISAVSKEVIVDEGEYYTITHTTEASGVQLVEYLLWEDVNQIGITRHKL